MTEFEIQLHDVMLFARHGVMPEERELGNQYRVNVRLRMNADWYDPEADNISATVSYADVYEVLKQVMARPRRVLESVAKDFGVRCLEKWSIISGGEIEIVKTVPPIADMIGNAGIRYIF